MCGILYLIRLFVNHAERGRTSEEVHLLLSGMEQRLYRYITFPAMLVAWVAGLGIIFTVPSFGTAPWFHMKLLFVVILTLFTLYSGRMVRHFSDWSYDMPSGKKLRILNEIPTLLMMVIVAAVVFKPFSQ